MFSQLQQTTTSNLQLVFPTQVTQSSLQGKMHIHLLLIAVVLISLHEVLAINVMPELNKNVLNFGYSANFKYEGMLTYSFDRFYVVAKCKIPKTEHLKFITFSFDLMCNHLNISKKSYAIEIYKAL